MALTHHVIIQVAAQRVGIKTFSNYVVLGDDVVIADNAVASSYKALLKELDMPYSFEKTHTSSQLYEFAKRWVYHGTEITGYSVGGLLSVWNKYPLLVNFVMNQADHG
jgi:hypothetical protein